MIGIISKSWSCAEAYHLCSVRVTWADGEQYMRTMCTLRAYLKGAPKGNQEVCVSRQCFTRRLTVGIAKGMPMLGNRHKKTDRKSVGLLWVYPGGP